MAKTKPKKIGAIQRISDTGRIEKLSAIRKQNETDAAKRTEWITGLDEEIAEYYKLLHGISKLEKARSSIGDVEGKFEAMLQSKLSGKEEPSEEIPINNQANSDIGNAIDIKI
jgi:hypothetical protein